MLLLVLFLWTAGGVNAVAWQSALARHRLSLAGRVASGVLWPVLTLTAALWMLHDRVAGAAE